MMLEMLGIEEMKIEFMGKLIGVQIDWLVTNYQ